jgi:hypothetical protein
VTITLPNGTVVEVTHDEMAGVWTATMRGERYGPCDDLERLKRILAASEGVDP